MDLTEFRKDMETLREKLAIKSEIKEEIIKITRKIVQESGLSIISLHKGEKNLAEKHFLEAKKYLEILKEMLLKNEEFTYSGEVLIAFQEFCEAMLFKKFIEEKRLINYKETPVLAEAYVTSLADFIGELRRLAIESLRKQNLEYALEILELMENIYYELMSTLLVSNIHGLRRKCDVARSLIEKTKSDILFEARRMEIEKSLEKFEEKISKIK
jgi:translin